MSENPPVEAFLLFINSMREFTSFLFYVNSAHKNYERKVPEEDSLLSLSLKKLQYGRGLVSFCLLRPLPLIVSFKEKRDGY